MEGHSDGELWGMTVCPKTGIVVTTADDNKALGWDPAQNKCVSKGPINAQAGAPKEKIGGASTESELPPNQCGRAVAINKVSGHVAIGCNDGSVVIKAGAKQLDQQVNTFQANKDWIETMRYSPDGNFLAVGCHDSAIYIYDATNYQQVSKFEKQTAFITCLDWSTDSQFIQSISASYELLFQTQNGEQRTEGATELRDEPWATWTCKLGWPVEGIYPQGVQGTHVHGVDRSKSSKLLATGDEWRMTSIFRYPAAAGAKPKSFVGHSEFVTRVKFNQDDSFLFSIGGGDRTLIQWKVV